MKLYFANTLPNAHKVRMTFIEKKVSDHVEMDLTHPFENSVELKAANPLSKVPTFVTATGEALYGSPVICEYIDAVGFGAKLFPESDDRRRVLTAAAACDGMLDALFGIVMERRRSEQQKSEVWLDRWKATVLRTADAAEAAIDIYEGAQTPAQISLSTAFGCTDFRAPDIDWRRGRPILTRW